MPEESTPDLVEFARRAFEAANRGDLDALMGFFAPDAVWESKGLGTSFEGEAIGGHYEAWRGVYEDYETELEEVLDLGNGVVFSVIHQSGRPAGSTGRVRVREAWVATVVDGTVTCMTTYLDIDEARAAAKRLAQVGPMPEPARTPDLAELTRRSIEVGGIDAAVSFYAPNAVWDASPWGMGVFEGRAAVRGFFEDWRSSYADLEREAEEIRDLGNGVTFAVVLQKGRVVGSSGSVQLRYASVAEWIDGLMLRNTTYTDIEEARAAAECLAESRG